MTLSKASNDLNKGLWLQFEHSWRFWPEPRYCQYFKTSMVILQYTIIFLYKYSRSHENKQDKKLTTICMCMHCKYTTDTTCTNIYIIPLHKINGVIALYPLCTFKYKQVTSQLFSCTLICPNFSVSINFDSQCNSKHCTSHVFSRIK